ncbi:MAG TPA: glycosyltransferase family 2 protein [Thermoanaerobaculia bacterium]|nr:glycosyltransferase family 2 protein [Thermoanaerobaculia bacterium]
MLAVVVHHRGEGLLAACLESLLASEGVRLEVVVVANACAERLPAILSDPRVHLVESTVALSFAAANNLAVEWAQRQLPAAEALYFLNNDTRSEPPALAAQYAALAADPRCGIAGPQLVIQGAEQLVNSLGLAVTEAGEAWDEGIGRPRHEFSQLPPVREVLAVTGSALLVRPEVLAEGGGWTELYGYYYEDIDLCLKARSRGWTVCWVRDAVVGHAISATSDAIASFKRRLSWRNQLVLLAVHWPWRLLLRVLPRLVTAQLVVFLRRLREAREDARLQLAAWGGALALLPRALAARRRNGPGSEWTRLLRPAGTVPGIELPDRRPRASLPETP